MTKKASSKTTGTSSKEGAEKVAAPSKLDTLVKLLREPTGASIDELATAAGWQKHSVRGALAGTLKKKGYVTTSEVVDGVRRYRVAETRQ